MSDLHRLFHSPHHLAVFEAAARLGSFTAAARELNVSQPAVSASVRQVETALGLTLFVRGHRSVTLTDAGRELASEATEGFQRMVRAGERLRAAHRGGHVTLAISSAFAAYWMAPRLGDFRARHRDIDLRLQTTDKDIDLTAEGLSLGVRRGDGNWRGYDSALIAEERLRAVAAPRYLAQAGPFRSLLALTRSRLIHLDEPFRPRPTWADWFAAMGQPYADMGDGLRLNDYAIVLQTAMAGEGVSLGWAHIVDRLIGLDLLAPAGEWEWRSGQGFWLIWSSSAPLSHDAEQVRDWIISAAA